MVERTMPSEYAVRGWYGNNTTIPPSEKGRIAEEDPVLQQFSERITARKSYRGEEAIHRFYTEWGLAPGNCGPEAYWEYENIDGLPPLPDTSNLTDIASLSLEMQLKLRGHGRLSKSTRNANAYEKNLASVEEQERVKCLANLLILLQGRVLDLSLASLQTDTPPSEQSNP